MKIICAGIWKTGTKSLANALRYLGYKVYDYDDQYFLLSALWDKFFDGSVTDDDIREALADVDVLIDGPVIAFWEEILKAIPDAKVILTSRQEDSWWKSFKAIPDGTFSVVKYLFLVLYLTPTGRPFVRNAMRVAQFCLGVEGLFRLPLLHISNNPRLYKNKFREHNCHVLQSVPGDKLLVYKAGDGWTPLCQFLGHDVPEIDYPFLNKEGAHFKSEGGPQNPAFMRAMKELLFIICILVAIISYFIYVLLT